MSVTIAMGALVATCKPTLAYGGPPVNAYVSVGRLAAGVTPTLGPFGISLSSDAVHYAGTQTPGAHLGTVTPHIDAGTDMVPNSGLIFVENSLTSGLNTAQLANSIGVSFTTMRAVRAGIPYWRFASQINKFARMYNMDPSSIRANFQRQINKALRYGSSQGIPGTTWGKSSTSVQSSYFGLGDPPNVNLNTLPSDPYQTTVTSGTSGTVSTALIGATELVNFPWQ